MTSSASRIIPLSSFIFMLLVSLLQFIITLHSVMGTAEVDEHICIVKKTNERSDRFKTKHQG